MGKIHALAREPNMDCRQISDDSESRFAAFVDGIVSVIGDADRAGPLRVAPSYPMSPVPKVGLTINPDPVPHQSRVRRKRVTAIVMASSIRANRAIVSYWRFCNTAPFSMMARTIRK